MCSAGAEGPDGGGGPTAGEEEKCWRLRVYGGVGWLFGSIGEERRDEGVEVMDDAAKVDSTDRHVVPRGRAQRGGQPLPPRLLPAVFCCLSILQQPQQALLRRLAPPLTPTRR